MSHSALVNSGNAAILGHSSFKLGNNSNTNNLNAAIVGGGPVTLGSTYGALGTGSGLHHQPPQLSRDNIFQDMTGVAAAQAHHMGPSRINGGSMI